MQRASIGVDVGGTFTDLILLDPQGRVSIAKVPTSIENQAHGVLAAIGQTSVNLADVGLIVHGTTTTTNAVLERKLARTGLITTGGFRDVLELGRRTRPKPYGLTGWFEPLIPRELRLDVSERMDADGEVIIPLAEDEFIAALKQLLDLGCESLVIHFLHAYKNPQHEQRALVLAQSLWPNAYITAGHAILSEYREYERGVTAAINAAVQPILDRYITHLSSGLRERGYRQEWLVMRGNGGTVSARTVAETAVNTVMSGPASGVMAAAYSGRQAGYANLITYDMGGTSCDVGLILNGVPAVSSELELEYAMPIHVPMVDVHTIGAGGGSIAFINGAGLLQVGPESAGAAPGPICYGRGGKRPTITDANLLLGRLNPDTLLAVNNPVPLGQVRTIFERELGHVLGLDATQTAAAILRIANDRMAGALRLVSLSRGHDPRDFALFAFGGAGPLHACALARELGIPQVLVPARPGITNALGCLVADLRHDFVNTVNCTVAQLDMSQVKAILDAQVKQGKDLIVAEQVAVDSIIVLHSVDMQFQGQSHLLRIPLESTDINREALHTAFEEAYWNRFSVELSAIRPVLVNLHTAVLGQRPSVDLRELLASDQRMATLNQAIRGERQVWFHGDWHSTPIYWREYLPVQTGLDGPAIIEQLDSTIVVPPDVSVRVDALGNLLLQIIA